MGLVGEADQGRVADAFEVRSMLDGRRGLAAWHPRRAGRSSFVGTRHAALAQPDGLHSAGVARRYSARNPVQVQRRSRLDQRYMDTCQVGHVASVSPRWFRFTVARGWDTRMLLATLYPTDPAGLLPFPFPKETELPLPLDSMTQASRSALSRPLRSDPATALLPPGCDMSIQDPMSIPHRLRCR